MNSRQNANVGNAKRAEENAKRAAAAKKAAE